MSQKIPQLSLTGNKKDNFRLWRTRFDDYCIIKEYRDTNKNPNNSQADRLLHYIEEKRPLEIASFRAGLPDEVLNVVQFNIEPQISLSDKTKPWIWMEKLAEYFGGQDTVMADRFEFQEQKQLPSESITDWETRIRQSANPLEYDEMNDQMMRDKFVFGLHSKDIRGELLKLRHRNPDGSILTLMQASQDASRLESAQQTNKRVEATTTNEQVNWTSRSGKEERPDRKPWQCWYCGGFEKHFWRECPANGKQCSRCEGWNHLAKVCPGEKNRQSARGRGRGRGRGRPPAPPQSQSRKPQQVHQMSETQDEIPDEYDFKYDYDHTYSLDVHEVGTTNGTKNKYFATLKLSTTEDVSAIVNCQIDSAATVNTMPEHILRRFRNPPKMQRTKVLLHPYSGPPIKPIGSVELVCERKKSFITLKFYVLSDKDIGDKPPLLSGSDSIKIGLIHINADSVCALETTTEAYQNNNLSNGIQNLTKEDILHKYKEQFTGIGDMGEMHFDLDPNVKPIQAPVHRVPFSKREKEWNTIQEYVRDGILTKVDEPTPWISNMVIKETATRFRICLDPSQTLNKAIRRPKYQIPTVEEQLPKLKDAKCFSIMDVNLGFTNIRLDHESSMATTMHTSYGRYRWLRLPFGVSSGPEEYQKRQHEILEGLPNIANIADDILVYGCGTTYEEAVQDHDRCFLQLLKRCKVKNLKLNPRKLQFRLKRVKFMGHILTDKGLEVDPEKVEAIQKMPTPRDKKGLQRYIGMVQYLSKFCPNLSSVIKPLRMLIRDDTEFIWSECQQQAYDESRNLISSTPVLKYYDVDKPVVLQVDASEDGIGGALLQQDDKSQWQPVAYTSCSMSATEVNYAQIEKETLAICSAFNKWDQWLYGKHGIIVHSDHQPLETIFKKPLIKAPRRLQKMMMRLQRYNFQVVYKRGTSLHIADTLSRAAVQKPVTAKVTGYEVFRTELEDMENDKNMRLTTATETEIQENTQRDPMLKKLCDMIKMGWPKSINDVDPLIKQYWNFREELTILNGVVYKGLKAVIPASLYPSILQKIHINHFGPESNLRMAREVLFWPNMRNAIYEMCQSCTKCAQFGKQAPTEPMMSLPIPGLPWQLVSQDLFQFDNTNYLVTVDHYSDFIELDKLENTLSSTIIQKTKRLFRCHGIPAQIHTDNGPQFISEEYHKFSRAYAFKHTTSSPYWSRGNGKAEAAVKLTKNLLKKVDDIDLALLNYSNTPQKGHDYSPAQRLMSRRTRTLLPTATHLLEPTPVDPMRVEEQILAKRQSAKAQYDKHTVGEHQTLPVGQHVYVKPPPHKRNAPWSYGRVVGTPSPRSYSVHTQGGLVRRNRVQLRPAAAPLGDDSSPNHAIQPRLRLVRPTEEHPAIPQIPEPTPPTAVASTPQATANAASPQSELGTTRSPSTQSPMTRSGEGILAAPPNIMQTPVRRSTRPRKAPVRLDL
jgi:transposase InsO family protein